VNDRESASRMRRYAADPDARNVIAARPFPSILGDPRGPPRGRPAADPHRRYYCSRHSPRGRTALHAFLFFCTLCAARSSPFAPPPPLSRLFLFFFSFFLFFIFLPRHINRMKRVICKRHFRARYCMRALTFTARGSSCVTVQ